MWLSGATSFTSLPTGVLHTITPPSKPPFIGNRIRHHAAAIRLYNSLIPAVSSEIYNDINHVNPNYKCNATSHSHALKFHWPSKTNPIIPRRSSPRNSSSLPSPSPPRPPRPRPHPQQPRPPRPRCCNQAARRSGFSPLMRLRSQGGL